MIRFLINKYRKYGWDIENWKDKKKKFKRNINYNINGFMIFNWILGRLNMAGCKSWSFYILNNVLLSLKKLRKVKKPIKSLSSILRKLKQNVLLFNKKKGSLVFELPRFLTIEQSIKKVIEWIIKSARKNNKAINYSLQIEMKRLFFRKGDVFTQKAHIKNILKKNKPFFYLLRKKKRK